MDNEDQSTLYIAIYGAIYLAAFTLISALSSIFKTYFFYTATSLIVAAYTSTRFVKKNNRSFTSKEKVKLTLGTFICTLSVNILYTPNVIGTLRSIDSLGACFFARQLFQFCGLWVIFGTNAIYESLKKQEKPQM